MIIRLQSLTVKEEAMVKRARRELSRRRYAGQIDLGRTELGGQSYSIEEAMWGAVNWIWIPLGQVLLHVTMQLHALQKGKDASISYKIKTKDQKL